MNLPQYNDPSLHGLEPITGEKKLSTPATSDEETEEPQEEKAEPETATVETQEGSAIVEMTMEETNAETVKVAPSSAVDTGNPQE